MSKLKKWNKKFLIEKFLKLKLKKSNQLFLQCLQGKIKSLTSISLVSNASLIILHLSRFSQRNKNDNVENIND